MINLIENQLTMIELSLEELAEDAYFRFSPGGTLMRKCFDDNKGQVTCLSLDDLRLSVEEGDLEVYPVDVRAIEIKVDHV